MSSDSVDAFISDERYKVLLEVYRKQSKGDIQV